MDTFIYIPAGLALLLTMIGCRYLLAAAAL